MTKCSVFSCSNPFYIICINYANNASELGDSIYDLRYWYSYWDCKRAVIYGLCCLHSICSDPDEEEIIKLASDLTDEEKFWSGIYFLPKQKRNSPTSITKTLKNGLSQIFTSLSHLVINI